MNVGVLVSGSGTNLQALIDRGRRGELGPARLTVVGANVPDCPALARARAAGLPTFVIDHRDYSARAGFDRALITALRSHQVDLVVMAGFMRVLGDDFLASFPDRIVNIHPALLPAFPGVHAQKQAHARGVKNRGLHRPLRRRRRRHRPDHRPGRRAGPRGGRRGGPARPHPGRGAQAAPGGGACDRRAAGDHRGPQGPRSGCCSLRRSPLRGSL